MQATKVEFIAQTRVWLFPFNEDEKPDRRNLENTNQMVLRIATLVNIFSTIIALFGDTAEGISSQQVCYLRALNFPS